MIPKNKLYFLIFFIALIISSYHSFRIDNAYFEMKLIRHTAIVSNTIEYPYKYRLLVPYMTEVYYTILKGFLPQKPAFLLSYAIQNFLVFLFLFFCLSKFFSLYFIDYGVLIGLSLFALLLILSITGYDTLGDMTTAGLLSLGFYLININKINYIYPLIFIGAFNEKQIVLLVFFYFFASASNFKSSKVWINSFLMLIAFALAYFIIYLIRGGQPSTDDIIWYFTKDAAFNLSNPSFIMLWIVMIAPLLYFTLKDFLTKPEFLRRNLLYVIPTFYIVAFFFIGRMREIDKALTIFVILIPLALMSLIPDFKKTKT